MYSNIYIASEPVVPQKGALKGDMHLPSPFPNVGIRSPSSTPTLPQLDINYTYTQR